MRQQSHMLHMAVQPRLKATEFMFKASNYTRLSNCTVSPGTLKIQVPQPGRISPTYCIKPPGDRNARRW